MSFLDQVISLHPIMSRSLRCTFLIAGLLVLPGFKSQQQALSEEYKIKAVFLYHFAEFVAWPTAAFSKSENSLIIGVLGDDPFGSYLDETVVGEKVNERQLVVNRYQNVSDIKVCHILFITKSAKEDHEEIFLALKGRNILTVSDVSGFTKRGGMIRFLNEDNKVKIKINVEAAKAEDLVISSKLLRIAEIVKTQN
jgi:hypothetical protein